MLQIAMSELSFRRALSRDIEERLVDALRHRAPQPISLTAKRQPDFEALEDAGLLSKEKLLAGDIPIGFDGGEGDGEEDPEGDVVADQLS